jgi:hypothetical protein
MISGIRPDTGFNLPDTVSGRIPDTEKAGYSIIRRNFRKKVKKIFVLERQ